MAEWVHFEIPVKLVGETTASGNDYVQTYRTEILLPKGSQYEGYCFQHPAKLVSTGENLAKVTYNDDFVFRLVKKDREPGKKYKRYSLTVSEILTIYAPVTQKVKEQLERAEKRRQAEVGQVEALSCAELRESYWAVVLRVGKKLYWPNGEAFSFSQDVCNRRVIATDVTRGSFETARDKLRSLCEEYRIVLDVKHAAEKNSGTGNRAVYEAVMTEVEMWEKEFYEKVTAVIKAKEG